MRSLRIHGMAILFIGLAIGLLPLNAYPQVGNTPVTVLGKPVPATTTQPVPVFAEMWLYFSGFSASADIYTVPQDKRLVIETVSIRGQSLSDPRCSGVGPAPTVFDLTIKDSGESGTTYGNFSFPLTPQGDFYLSGYKVLGVSGAHQVRIYVDANRTVSAYLERPECSTSTVDNFRVSFSGYLLSINSISLAP